MVPNLPTIMSSRSLACGRRRVQMSMVKRVLLLLKMEASELIRAASITASIRPLRPAGQSYNKARAFTSQLAKTGTTEDNNS